MADRMTPSEPSTDAVKAPGAPPASPVPSAAAPNIVLRVLLGFAGLTLLVGFFLPWVHVPTQEEGAAATMQSGFDLMSAGDLAGTPSLLLLGVPVLGVVLSATSFMGFRFSGQAAIAVAALLIAYALYVLLHLFVQHTGRGLWIVAGGTLLILFLGVITWVLGRDKKERQEPEAPSTPN